MQVCVCGGRDYQDAEKVNYVLTKIHKKKSITLIINGGAKGADLLSSDWAINNKVPLVVANAEWDKHGKAAGHIRNKMMIDHGFDVLVAFPGGRGTENMIMQTHKAKINVLLIS